MRYTKVLDQLLRQRIALQREWDEHHSMYLTHRREAAVIVTELAKVDRAIATHVEANT